MDIIEQLQWRYATKKFDTEKILSQDQLNTLKQAFNLTATSFGLQTIKLVVVKSKSLRANLLEHSFNQKQVVDASHLLVICIQKQIEKQDVIAHYDNIKAIRNTPETILNPYKNQLIEKIESMSVQECQQWSKNQAYIALGNLMTVCATQNIDACPMEGFNSSAYDSTLELDALGLKSALLLPVGYRAKDDMFSELKKVRKPIAQTIIEL